MATEGKTKVFVPVRSNTIVNGPGICDGHVFYNPVMELNRDLSVLVAQWFVGARKRSPVMLDGLAASGIRGIRFANEVIGDFEVIVNDWDSKAFYLIKKNIRHNNLRNAVASNKDLNTMLSDTRCDYVDIDPFGSPAYFVDSAVRSLFDGGIMACTATDTAALCGVYPKVCLRRYGAVPFHSWMMHEIGLRVLIGFIVREAAKYDKGVEPLLCYYSDHYFRVYVQIINGVKNANKSLRMISYMNVDSNGVQVVSFESGQKNVGPLWVGSLHNKKVLACLIGYALEKTLNTKKKLLRLLDLFDGEVGISPFYYTVEDVASSLKIPSPKMQDLAKGLKNKGFVMRRTHFSPTGFKTDAPFDEIKNVFVDLQQVY